MITMPNKAFEDIIEAAAERAAKKALASVGLQDDQAAKDMGELRSLLDAYRAVKTGAYQQVGKYIVTAIVVGLLLFVAVKAKIISIPAAMLLRRF